MKNITLLFILSALFLQSCSTISQGDYDPKPVTPTPSSKDLTYDQINGNYRLTDSTYFEKTETLEQPTDEDKHVVSRAVNIGINTGTSPSASFLMDDHTYFEDRNVSNEYKAADAYYDIRKVNFIKDSIIITYYKGDYSLNNGLYITVKGYKL